ncbi:hypothetical protein P154DRAFT_614736 [Amniculicola lignicola CBS 123094]|uniref:Uncharacterized protein n=1 Tax=Amniculicola lignicola CBS 123094 TaxID=1392246 RepID=A0A6A5X351_9PLEO|nr:hypothetical protein P154DRAFT_614736 [Amniculicola lignicola CBS 123094]
MSLPPPSKKRARPTTPNPTPSDASTPHISYPPTKKQKQPRLPPNTKISKRPIHRPSIPHASTSSASPKTLYITANSPFIPAIKRVRKLLSSVAHRAAQSQAAQPVLTFNPGDDASRVLRANGRLQAGDVERVVAEEGRRKLGPGGGSGKGNGRKEEVAGEKVYVKATGKAIERALEIGVYFQGEADCRVGVEIGSVRVVDDVEVVEGEGEGEGEHDTMEVDRGVANGENVEGMEVANGGGEKEDQGKKKTGKVKKRAKKFEGEIPETRIRTLSSVTVSISLR